MAVTQQQIADRLNISRSWVARALNGYDTVSPEMREKVHSVARELGYDLGGNQAARAMVARRYGQKIRNNILAVAFPPLLTPSPRHLPFFTPFLDGMETEAAGLGLDIFAFSMRYDQLPRLIRERGVDGVVSIGFLQHEVARIRDLDLPVVTYQVEYENAHSLMVDDREGTRLLTRHLLELGHREIAFVGLQRQWDTGQTDALRQEGYEMALAEYGVKVRPEWIDTSRTLPNTSSYKYCCGCEVCAACVGWQSLCAQAGVSESQPPFTAVVCHGDMVAMGIIERAQSQGLSVPGDLSVVGFDNVSHLYHSEPSITSIGFSRFEMGRAAVQVLHTAIEDENQINKGDYYEHRVFPVTLVENQSTAPLSRH